MKSFEQTQQPLWIREIVVIRELILCMALVTFTLSPADAQTLHELFGGGVEVTIPDDYEAVDTSDFDPNEYAPGQNPHAGTSWFISRGGRAALAQELPNIYPEKHSWRDEFRDDIRAFVILRVADLIAPDRVGSRDRDDGFWMAVPKGSSAQEIHDRFCNSFSAKWGEKYTFDLYDAETGIGRCVNTAGAFVAVFTRKVGDSLVMIEAMDLVKILVWESQSPSIYASEMSDYEKWDLIKLAANAKAAEKILLSARVLP